MKNLIIATSFGYKYSMIQPFIESLNTVFDGDLLLFTDKKYRIRNKSFSTEVINPIKKNKSINRGFNTPNNFRYFWYEDFLSQISDCENVLITDIRDVVFQDDPFRNRSHKIYVAEEEAIIGHCRFNSGWIEGLYGGEFLCKIRDQKIKCSGTILGSLEQIKFLTSYIANHLEQYGTRLDTGDHSMVLDQGAYHAFIDEHKEMCGIKSNREGTIATLAYAKQIRIDKEGMLLNDNSVQYSIVHQYDRIKWLRGFYNKKFRN